MIPGTGQYNGMPDRAADQRWVVWVTKGVEHDRRVKYRAMLAAAGVLCAATVWAATILFR